METKKNLNKFLKREKIKKLEKKITQWTSQRPSEVEKVLDITWHLMMTMTSFPHFLFIFYFVFRQRKQRQAAVQAAARRRSQDGPIPNQFGIADVPSGVHQ